MSSHALLPNGSLRPSPRRSSKNLLHTGLSVSSQRSRFSTSKTHTNALQGTSTNDFHTLAYKLTKCSTIKPYDGPIPDLSPPSPLLNTEDHFPDHQLLVDQNEHDDLGQTKDFITDPYHASIHPSMMDAGVWGQQSVEDGVTDTGCPYDLDQNNQYFQVLDSSGFSSNTMEEMIDPLLRGDTGVSSYTMTNTYQPDTLIGTGTQFPQAAAQWIEFAPAASTHDHFSGYACRLDVDPEQTTPSLDNTLLNSAAPEPVLSGQHSDHLLLGPATGIDYTIYGENPADSASIQREPNPQNSFSGALGGDDEAVPLQDPLGCSLQSATYTDSSGWWYDGHHDGWCRIPSGHRHDYDGGVYFRHYESYTHNIYTEQNDHVTGYLLGLCTQLQTRHPGAGAVCLHQDCEEARRVAQGLVDASLPADHDLRQAPLCQPHPAVIMLLNSLNDRLPEGYVYDPLSQRIVRYDVPDMGLPLLSPGDLTNPVDYAGQQTRPQ